MLDDVESSAPELSTEVSSSDPMDSGGGPSSHFEIDGQKYTADQIKQWRDAEKRFQADYTRKTQTFSQERTQWNNSAKAQKDGGLEADLDRVKNGQASIADFKRVYHKDFHHHVDQLLTQTKNHQPNGVDPAFLSRVNQIEQHFHKIEVDALDKELNVKELEYTKKYPYADQAAVYSQANALLDAKKQDGQDEKITDQEWDKMWKAAHEKQSERFKQYQSSLVKGQKQQNARSRDVGAGGGIPGQAPKTAKNIKQATELAMQHLDEF